MHQLADNREFSFIWDNIVLPIAHSVRADGDTFFAESVGLHFRGDDTSNTQWKAAVENEFHHQRHNFKEQCYGKRRSSEGDPLLDSRKVAAVLCKTFLRCKAFQFDVNIAGLYAKKQKGILLDIEYTKWAVDNTLINYKFAYLVSQKLVFLTLLADLLKEENTIRQAELLNQSGRLFSYLPDSGCDTFDVNIVLGLARDDVRGRKLNMMLYAMILYQQEMYTRECLKSQQTDNGR